MIIGLKKKTIQDSQKGKYSWKHVNLQLTNDELIR